MNQSMNLDAEFGMLTAHLANLHVQQTRKGPRNGVRLRVPYVVHPLQVLQRVQRWGIDDHTEENKAFWKGLLYHDAIEDTTATYEHILGVIGKHAADIVMDLTRPMHVNDTDYMASFADKHIEVVVGKIADRLCNVDDFIFDRPAYAFEYFHKADPLFYTYHARKDEAVARFGLCVTEAINKDLLVTIKCCKSDL